MDFYFRQGACLRRAEESLKRFEQRFWAGGELGRLYEGLEKKGPKSLGLEYIFYCGYKEFLRQRDKLNHAPRFLLEAVQRSMRVAEAREEAALDQHLSFLATVGSISPYVGLFGTVWGIMTVFHT